MSHKQQICLKALEDLKEELTLSDEDAEKVKLKLYYCYRKGKKNLEHKIDTSY